MPDMTPTQSHILLSTDLNCPCYKLLAYFSTAFQNQIHYYLQTTQLYEEAKETILHSEKECTV